MGGGGGGGGVNWDLEEALPRDVNLHVHAHEPWAWLEMSVDGPPVPLAVERGDWWVVRYLFDNASHLYTAR